eukprot:scaffold647_cov411-Prasinococcus_capsulatus_cf.AAC.25
MGPEKPGLSWDCRTVDDGRPVRPGWKMPYINSRIGNPAGTARGCKVKTQLRLPGPPSTAAKVGPL